MENLSQRIELLGVPVDVVKPENMENLLFQLHEQAGIKQIIFLSIWDLLKARRSSTYLNCLKNAALILPTSKSIVKGAKFLKLDVPERYNPFTTIISFMTSLETRYKSLYLLGGRKGSLRDSEKNIRATYPGLQIVGRCVGYFSKNVEKDVISAIYKANPSLVLASDGIPKGERWIYDRRNQFGSSIFIYNKDILNIFSLRKKRVSKETFQRGNEIWHEVFHNPIKIFLIFPYFWYKLLLLCTRLFKRNKSHKK